MLSRWKLAVARSSVALGLTSLFAGIAIAQVSPNKYAGLVWRNIGPFRAGRISAVSAPVGPGQAGVFYDALPEGGVWKTVNAGMTWVPIFDAVKTVSSVGAIAVAQSDPNIIYVGTGDLVGEGAIDEGDGVYKSTDAGKTWVHIGLEATKQIPALIVDPKNPNIVLLAAQGDIHHPSHDRGIFRSTDGGQTWKQVLFRSDIAGGQDVEFAYDNPNVVFATTVRHMVARGAPMAGGEGGIRESGNNETALYKSTDEGATWTEVKGGGLPELTGRTSVAVAANTNAQRVFLIGPFGLWRSDDGGANWRRMNTDPRIAGNGYICGVMVDTKNPDVVYVMSRSVYRSTDGGATFTAFKGAPGGDDYHYVWIDPTDPNRMSLASDEGATVSLDGGLSWSSWYNQPTAQTYHIAIGDEIAGLDDFIYWVYGTQQDPCAVAERNRGDFGETTPWDWTPFPAYEIGSLAAEPDNPDIVYGGGPDNGILKIWLKTGQWENFAPNIGAARGGIGSDFRKSIEFPMVFSPEHHKTLYLATQYVTATSDGGMHWRNLGDKDLATRDLTPEQEAAVKAAGRGAVGGRGAIASIAPSTVTDQVIWTGSNNGLIYVTKDGGKTWTETDLKLPYNANVVIMDASHSNPAEAYAAVDLHAAGDYTPYIYRTRDYGGHWDLITNGLPTNETAGSFVRVVREDIVKKGLLFAGTESSVYVSFDDGDHWQSLQLNLPVVSYRDLIVHGKDLVAGTFGRSFWVLDDISPLRQISADLSSKPAYLFKPADVYRIRKDVNRNTPLPPEIPHGLNPPDGAILYYYLGSNPSGEVKIDIFDAANNLVRSYSSAPIPPVTIDPRYEFSQFAAPYWYYRPEPMPTEVGTNRINWDLHYTRPPSLIKNFANEKFDALYHDTDYDPQGPLVVPGVYTVKLTANGTTSTQTITVKMDPRDQGQATQADLVAMHGLLMKVYKSMFTAWDGYQEVRAMRDQLKTITERQLPSQLATAATEFDGKLAGIEGEPPAAGQFGGSVPGHGDIGFGELNIQFGGDGQTGYISAFGTADVAPTPAERRAYQISCTHLNSAIGTWTTIKDRDVSTFNTLLRQNNLPPLPVPNKALATTECGAPVVITPPGAPALAAR